MTTESDLLQQINHLEKQLVELQQKFDEHAEWTLRGFEAASHDLSKLFHEYEMTSDSLAEAWAFHLKEQHGEEAANAFGDFLNDYVGKLNLGRIIGNQELANEVYEVSKDVIRNGLPLDEAQEKVNQLVEKHGWEARARLYVEHEGPDGGVVVEVE